MDLSFSWHIWIESVSNFASFTVKIITIVVILSVEENLEISSFIIIFIQQVKSY